MLKSRFLTPFDSQGHKPPNEVSDLSLPRLSLATQHSSTPSGISLGKKIQRHLDAGKPLYIGFDPADPRNEDGGEQGGRMECIKQINKYKKWLRVLTFGAPLDIAVKFILTVGMTVSLLALLWGMNWLIQNRKLDKDFNVVMVIGQCIWGIFFGTSCIFGMELMWGKWRRSPSAALFFTVCWVLVSLVLLVTSAVWIYFYLLFRATRTQKCMEQTVKVTITWDKDSLRRMAPQAQINNCLDKIGSKVNWTLAWGIGYAIFSYFGMIVVIWGRDYRRRLLEIKECEEAKTLSNNGGNDKVGLLLGTAPLGRLSDSRITGPSKSSLERDRDIENNTRPPLTGETEERTNTGSIIRISGTVTPYGNQRNIDSITRPNSTRSMASSIYSVSSKGLGVSVEGQSFVGTSR